MKLLWDDDGNGDSAVRKRTSAGKKTLRSVGDGMGAGMPNLRTFPLRGWMRLNVIRDKRWYIVAYVLYNQHFNALVDVPFTN
jgi:hypothetical protein